MTRLTFAALALTLATTAGCAVQARTGPGSSEPMPPPPPSGDVDRPRPRGGSGWNSSGWVLLGERSVEGTNDRDTIRVDRRGQYSAITIVAEDGEFEMADVIVTFDTDRTFSPKVKHNFREGDRTRAIDLPGEARGIKEVSLLYHQKGGRARVQVWGREGAAPMRPTKAAPNWDTGGWDMLGEAAIESTNDRDTMQVNRRVSSLTFWAADGDFEMGDVVVTFDNGRTWSPNLKQTFRSGEKKTVELPNSPRAVKEISLLYHTIQGKNARIQVWAK